jgi:16S rRNA (guanine527-N7)-methyltransferase
VCSRAEEWREGVSRCDVVTARALAPQPVVLEYAAPLLRMGGTLVDWRGRRDEAAEEAAQRAAALLGLSRAEIRRVIPFEGASDHHLHVFVKTGETPARFPRRAGIARKRPLGA